MDPIFSTLFFLWGVVTGWGVTEVYHGVFHDDSCCPVIEQQYDVEVCTDTDLCIPEVVTPK